MKRAFWITGVAMSALLATASGSALAQDEGEDACHEACTAQEQACTDACSNHDDPVECAAACRDAAFQCRERCRG